MEKIRITTEEVSRAVVDSVPPTPPPPNPSLPPLSPPIKKNLTPWIVATCVGGIVIFILAFASFKSETGASSMDKWKAAALQQLNEEFNSAPNSKSYIESVHPLVTFTGANVKSLEVRTVDGSNAPGIDGSNISEIEYVVTFRWEGPVNKNGFTEILYVWDTQARVLKSSKCIATNAVIKVDDVDWFEVGKQVAPLLLLPFGL